MPPEDQFKTRFFFGWISPDGKVRVFDGLSGKPTDEIIGQWTRQEVAGRTLFIIQTNHGRYTTVLDWNPLTGNGSVALFRFEAAGKYGFRSRGRTETTAMQQ